MDTVFVTGGSSTLGHHVLRNLASRVCAVATVHRRNVEIPGVEIELLHGGLEEAVRNPRADVVRGEQIEQLTHVARGTSLKVRRAVDRKEIAAEEESADIRREKPADYYSGRKP